MRHSYFSLILLISLMSFSVTMLVAQVPPALDPFGAPAADPFGPAPAANDPFAPAPAFAVDPFAPAPAATPAADPFAPGPLVFPAVDPFASVSETIKCNAMQGVQAGAFYSALAMTPPLYADGGAKLFAQAAKLAVKELKAADPAMKYGLEVFGTEVPSEQFAKLSPAERLAAQLERPVKMDFNQNDLAYVREAIEVKLKIPVVIDKKTLEEAAFDLATPIDWYSGHPIKLRLALKHLLANLALTYYTDEGTLVITTKFAAENRLIVRTYPIDPELLKVRKRFRRPPPFYGQFGGYGGGGFFNVMQLGGESGGGLVGTIPSHVGGGFGGGSGTLNLFAEYDEVDSLVNLITSIIQPITWRENGGLGNIEPNLKLGLLVVSNTEEVQDEVAALLTVFNKQLAERKPPPVSPDTVERVVHPVVLPAVRLKQQNPLDHHRPISKEPAFTMEQLAEQLKKQIEPASWTNPQYTITTLGQNLIVNQTHANQEKIRAFLRQLGITKEQVDDEKQFAEEQEQARKDLNLRQEQERERIELERVKRNAAEQRQREEREAEEQRKRDEQQRKLLEEQKKREAESRQREAEAIKRRSES